MASLVETARCLIGITRPINVAIVALTQFLIYYLLLFPLYETYGVKSFFDWSDVGALIIVTALSLAIGNIYNDIKDRDADIVNKPKNTYIQNGKLSVLQAKTYMYILLGIVIALVAYKAIILDILKFLPYFLLVIASLYIYSAYLKGMPLLGNILVALLSSLVAGIIWIVEYPSIQYLPTEPRVRVVYIFFAYLSFSFLVSLYREIVKDLQDQEGDALIHAHTLPIAIGVTRTKVVAAIVGIILIASYSLWYRIPTVHTTLSYTIYTVLLVLPTLFTLWKLWYADTSKEYGMISTYIKCIMAMALVIFILILAS